VSASHAPLQFLKEGFTLVDLVGTAVCFTGVVFVAQPAVLFGKSTADEKHSTNAVSVAVSLAGALLSSCGYIFVRMLGGQGANANMVVLWFGVVGTIIGVCMTAILREPLVWPWTGAQAGSVVLASALCACSGPVSRCCALLFCARFGPDVWFVRVHGTVYNEQRLVHGESGASCHDAVSVCVVVQFLEAVSTYFRFRARYLDIVFSFIWQLTVLSESVNAWSGLGAALVTSCAFVNPVKQWWMSRKRDPEETKPLLLDTELPKVKTVDTGRSIASTPLHESKSGDENLDRFYQGASEDEGGQAEVDDAPLVSPDVNLTK
jgi:drug/metabolite transporter (DMT)-like permease